MPFITFIYKVGKNPKKYYGKYCIDYMSDDHEGLDEEVKYILHIGLHEYRLSKGLKKREYKLKVGILSFSSNRVIPTYSTDADIEIFDFYHTYDNKIYINGTPV